MTVFQRIITIPRGIKTPYHSLNGLFYLYTKKPFKFQPNMHRMLSEIDIKPEKRWKQD
ncbi:hypothetical protein SAMN03080601_01088 [Alkalitalea saponilacus]|uniref:Uncharacterized protein n=1 Tax=Alkalitalea saponilacus TaxID=889453 RepID=A0A1T5DEK3_9BACT|nr:hypothetical protein SAMN03080601_01088 [Alkalitalea saponilacus]